MRICHLETHLKCFKNENRKYISYLKYASWGSPKSGIKTPTKNKMRKLGKYRNRRIRPVFRKTLKITKLGTNHTNMILKWYLSLSHRYPVQNSDISPNGATDQFSRNTTKTAETENGSHECYSKMKKTTIALVYI